METVRMAWKNAEDATYLSACNLELCGVEGDGAASLRLKPELQGGRKEREEEGGVSMGDVNGRYAEERVPVEVSTCHAAQKRAMGTAAQG